MRGGDVIGERSRHVRLGAVSALRNRIGGQHYPGIVVGDFQNGWRDGGGQARRGEGSDGQPLGVIRPGSRINHRVIDDRQTQGDGGGGGGTGGDGDGGGRQRIIFGVRPEIPRRGLRRNGKTQGGTDGRTRSVGHFGGDGQRAGGAFRHRSLIQSEGYRRIIVHDGHRCRGHREFRQRTSIGLLNRHRKSLIQFRGVVHPGEKFQSAVGVGGNGTGRNSYVDLRGVFSVFGVPVAVGTFGGGSLFESHQHPQLGAVGG